MESTPDHSSSPTLQSHLIQGATCLRWWRLRGALPKCPVTEVPEGDPVRSRLQIGSGVGGRGPSVLLSHVRSSPLAGCRGAKQDCDLGEELAGGHRGSRAAGDLRPVRQPGPSAAARGWRHRHRGVPGAPGGPQGLQTPGLLQGRAAADPHLGGVKGAAGVTVLAETWPVRAWSAATFSVTSVNLSPDRLSGRENWGGKP